MSRAHRKTEIGEFPNTWEVDRVDSVFEIQQGKQVSKKNRVGDNQRPFLRTKNVFWDRLELQPGDLLTCEGGHIGRTAIWKGNGEGCYYQNHLHRLRVVNDRVDPQFGVYWFWYAFQVGKLYFGRGNVTTIPNLSKSKLSELPIALPPLPEQEKIAYILFMVQQSIETQERIIQITTELKMVLMQKLFTEGLRNEPQKQTEIGPVPQSWEVVELEAKAESFQYGTSVKCGYEVNGNPVLRIPNIVGGHVDVADLKFGNLKKNELGKMMLQAGDLLFVRTNGVKENAGRCSLFNNELDDCYYASYLIRVRLDPAILNPSFLSEYSRTETGTSFLSGRSVRTADGKFNINSGTLKTMLVPVPEIDEQEEITQCLALLDRKIAVAHSKKSSLSDLFRTLLHELMTAKIRVHHFEISDIRNTT